METRLNAYKASPDAIAAMTRLEEYVQNCGLEHSLIYLVKTRASQINGCAYCLHMHTSDAREAGESEVRFYLLSAWGFGRFIRTTVIHNSLCQEPIAMTEQPAHQLNHWRRSDCRRWSVLRSCCPRS